MAQVRPQLSSAPEPLQRSAVDSLRVIDPPRIFTYVDAVARHGSIRKAAEALHVVSSALNRRILDLEEELGAALFERMPRGVRPTAAGELFLGFVRRSLRELEQVGAQIEALKGGVSGKVRVGVAESMTGTILPNAVAEFQRAYPKVCFHVWVDGPRGLADALRSDAADMILTHEPSQHPEVQTLARARQTLCALVVAGHPLAERKSLLLADCLDYPLAMPDASLAARHMLDRALEAKGLRFTPALVSNSIELTKTFARQNQAMCFQFRSGDDVAAANMIEIPLVDPELAHAQLLLAVRRERVLPAAAAAFAEQLAACFASLDDSVNDSTGVLERPSGAWLRESREGV
jgi:DNA-binding transcriptional LysR family regulator